LLTRRASNEKRLGDRVTDCNINRKSKQQGRRRGDVLWKRWPTNIKKKQFVKLGGN